MEGVCGRELNGGENSLHWKANMLPLFSIMTLCALSRVRAVQAGGAALFQASMADFYRKHTLQPKLGTKYFYFFVFKYLLQLYLNTKYFQQMYLCTKYIDAFEYFSKYRPI